MSVIKWFLNFFLHIDKNLLVIVQHYGVWSYALLFVVIFMETGLVVTPFLPGDSLLFAAGSLAALGAFQLWSVLLVCILAAFVGDTVNYWIGRKIGPELFEKNSRLFKKEYLEKAHQFYEKHGGVAIILARFVPIIRTFAPCVAGVSEMSYGTFLLYNVIGGVLWVALFTLTGYFFGNIPFVKHNFELVMVAIILISVIPIAYEFLKSRREKQK